MLVGLARTKPVRGALSLALPRTSRIMGLDSVAFEKHYRVAELAKLWGLGRETLRVIVKDEPGVIKIRMGPKKAPTTYGVPESVAQRIHTKLLNSA